MQWALFQLLTFLASASQISSNLEGRMSVTRKIGSSVAITCDLSQISANYIHWYQFQERKAPQHLLYQDRDTNTKVVVDLGNTQGKYQAYKSAWNRYELELKNLENSDSGVYSCATCTPDSSMKDFSRGTKLVVTDKTFYTDISPKPTTFLSSVAETNLHDAGTYLCLLEKFFPDVIYVQWKEKNGSRILESQQGKTVMTDNTYMKLSWLTVTGNSLNKEHQCIVKHENNKGGVDQEILFPPIKKAILPVDPKEASSADQAQLRRQRLWEALRLQLINASAYHTYLLLLLKSVVYFSIITFCLFRRAAVCGTGNSVS